MREEDVTRDLSVDDTAVNERMQEELTRELGADAGDTAVSPVIPQTARLPRIDDVEDDPDRIEAEAQTDHASRNGFVLAALLVVLALVGFFALRSCPLSLPKPSENSITGSATANKPKGDAAQGTGDAAQTGEATTDEQAGAGTTDANATTDTTTPVATDTGSEGATDAGVTPTDPSAGNDASQDPYVEPDDSGSGEVPPSDEGSVPAEEPAQQDAPAEAPVTENAG